MWNVNSSPITSTKCFKLYQLVDSSTTNEFSSQWNYCPILPPPNRGVCLLNTNFTHSYKRAPPKHYTPLLFASIRFFFVTFLNFCTNLSIQNFHQFVHNTFSFLGNQTVLQREVIDYNTSMSKQNGQDCDMLPGMSKVFNAIEFPTKITRVNPGMLIIPPS